MFFQKKLSTQRHTTSMDIEVGWFHVSSAVAEHALVPMGMESEGVKKGARRIGAMNCRT